MAYAHRELATANVEHTAEQAAAAAAGCGYIRLLRAGTPKRALIACMGLHDGNKVVMRRRRRRTRKGNSRLLLLRLLLPSYAQVVPRA
jgi:hypothetical protein